MRFTRDLSMRRGRSGESGMSIIEVAVTMALFGLSALGVLGVMSYSARLNALNKETAAATQAARSVIEQMRGRTGRNVVRDFNSDPNDDVAGVGLAPGDSFIVDGLGMEGDAIGTVVLPLVAGAVREDVTNAALGLPRDLNGDNALDADDRKDDFIILPVIVRVEWTGVAGDRTLEFHTLLKPEE